MTRLFFALVIILFVAVEVGSAYLEFTQIEIDAEELELPKKRQCFWTSPEAKTCIEQMTTFSE